jgi:hypothetical protein
MTTVFFVEALLKTAEALSLRTIKSKGILVAELRVTPQPGSGR